MARDDEAELSIGGPGGVHIRVGGTPVVRTTPEHELSTIVAFARSHPRAIAGGLVFAGLAGYTHTIVHDDKRYGLRAVEAWTAARERLEKLRVALSYVDAEEPTIDEEA